MKSSALQTMKHFVHLISQQIVLIVLCIPILPSSQQSVGTSTPQTSRATFKESSSTNCEDTKLQLKCEAVVFLLLYVTISCVDHNDKCWFIVKTVGFCVHSSDLLYQTFSQNNQLIIITASHHVISVRGLIKHFPFRLGMLNQNK